MDLKLIEQAVRTTGCAWNAGEGGEYIIMGTRQQIEAMANKLTDAMWAASINRRAEVEQLMFDAARGKRPMPSAEELRAWALKLGTVHEHIAAARTGTTMATRRQYFYKVDGCRARDPRDPACICWHDAGTGPLADSMATATSWRDAPVTPTKEKS